MIILSCSGLSEVLTFDQASQSNFLSTMIEYDPTLASGGGVIELPLLDVRSFSTIVQFLKQRNIDQSVLPKVGTDFPTFGRTDGDHPLDDPHSSDLQARNDPERLNKELFDLLYFAEYMDIPSLIFYLTNHIASLLRYKSVEQLNSSIVIVGGGSAWTVKNNLGQEGH